MLLLFFPINSVLSKNTEEVLVKLFSTVCISNINDLNKIKTIAKTNNWKDAPKEVLTFVSPTVKGSEYKGWVLKEEKYYVIMINKAENTNVCTISHRFKKSEEKADINNIINILKRNYKINLIKDEIEGYQRWIDFDAEVSTIGKVGITIQYGETSKGNKIINLHSHFKY